MQKYLRSSAICALVLLTPSTSFAGELSHKIYQEFDPGGGVPACYIHRCVSVGRAGDSERNAVRGGQVVAPPTNPTNETDTNASFESNYQVPPGVLGANTDLESEFSDFVNANREFIATFGGDSALSTGQTPVDSFNLATAIQAVAPAPVKKAWEKIINSQNAYFDSIAALADANTDPEAQNAIAHATISAHLGIDASLADAKLLGEAKEFFTNGGKLDTAKDFRNNAAGIVIAIRIAQNGGSAEDIPQAIADAYRNGELWIIRNGKIVPSNSPK